MISNAQQTPVHPKTGVQIVQSSIAFLSGVNNWCICQVTTRSARILKSNMICPFLLHAQSCWTAVCSIPSQKSSNSVFQMFINVHKCSICSMHWQSGLGLMQLDPSKSAFYSIWIGGHRCLATWPDLHPANDSDMFWHASFPGVTSDFRLCLGLLRSTSTILPGQLRKYSKRRSPLCAYCEAGTCHVNVVNHVKMVVQMLVQPEDLSHATQFPGSQKVLLLKQVFSQNLCIIATRLSCYSRPPISPQRRRSVAESSMLLDLAEAAQSPLCCITAKSLHTLGLGEVGIYWSIRWLFWSLSTRSYYFPSK